MNQNHILCKYPVGTKEFFIKFLTRKMTITIVTTIFDGPEKILI